MNFENKTPEWPKEGIEPSSEIKSKGFAPGYKPPAAYFNWFWNSVSKNLAEIKTKLSNVDNTADSEKTVKRATTAGTADKTAQKMTVQLNGGTTEGTDKFTFDGSAAKSVDITKDAIGLGNVDNTADSTKSVSFASTAGSVNKTKSAMTVRLNGGSSEGQDKYTFDGSVAKSVNITPASIGAASTANGAVVSNGSDYAICFQWSDGNPNKDIRTNRFVRLTDGGNKISLATSSADICGVTTDSAAFVENYGVASDSTALVGVLGVVTVIDNGPCTVGNTCMSDDNGYATPSSKNLGYRVMERVDDTKVKISVKPNDDMVQRIKTDIVSIKSGMKEVYTKAQVEAKIKELLAAQREEDLARIKIWASTDPTSPASFIGGTWERVEGKFIMGASDTYPARSTGGEAAHALTINETPNHVHYVGAYGNPVWQLKVNGNVGGKMTANSYVLINNASFKNESITDNGFLGTSYVGEDEPHNNLPPYIAVYIWVRVDDAA